MENLTLTNIALALLGMTIHILMKISERKNKTKKASLIEFLAEKMNWVRITLALLSTFAILLMAHDLGNIIGVTLDDGTVAMSVVSFLAGYSNHSLIRNVLKIFKKQTTNEIE